MLDDHGYHGIDYREALFEETGLLVCSTTDMAKPERRLLSSLRQRIETTFSQVWAVFISRSFSGLWQMQPI